MIKGKYTPVKIKKDDPTVGGSATSWLYRASNKISPDDANVINGTGRLKICDSVGKKSILGRCHPREANIRHIDVSRSCDAVHCVKGCLLFAGGLDLSAAFKTRLRLSSSVPE
jgi:hypothetical protein